MSKSMTKISAVMLAVMTLLSSIFVFPANAATGDKVTISFNYCYDTNGNLIKYQQTTVNDGYTVGSAGDELLITYVDGREAYCIQPGHALYAGDQLTEGSSSAWNSLGTAKQNTINLALLCGKPGSGSSLPGNSDEKWAATQLIVWEIVSGCRETSGSYNCTNTKYINGITAGGANSGVRSAYNQIVTNMQTLRKIPSFAADSTGSSMTYEMNASGGSYTLTLTDSNSVLGKFDFKSNGGVTVSKSGNKLTLTAKSPINSAVALSASKSVSGASASLIAYGDSGLQDVVSGASGITVSAYFKVKATPGSLKLVKTSEDGKVSGIEFTVKGTNYNKTVKTNSKGEFTLSDLVPGTYTVTEKEDSRYEKQSPKTVKVESGKTASVSFKNTLRTGDLKIIKTSDDGIVADIEFTVTGTNYSKTAKSDKNGEIILTDLVPGLYKVTEKTDPRYEDQEPKMVMVEADKTSTVKYKNILRKGDLKIIKTSEDGIVADIEFTVTGTNYSKTAKSDKNGEIILPDLVPGLYKVTEKTDPRYEDQEPKMVMVEADKTSTVRFKNVLRTGGLRIIKTSDDGIVADIEFTVTGKDYNKTAKSDESGEILLRDLTPGTYTVTEKEDERYEAQVPRTITVEADKTATVKFKNTLRKGGLKIIKTSDDGIVADIEFTVTGTNYSKTAKSDKNGEIHLPDLIPGTYTVTEKEDSRYEKQSPKTVKVEADKTATVKFKNTLRTGDLKIIKTSDDGIVADIEFTITGKNNSKTAKSDKNGEIHLADLIPGTYTVTEKVDARYEAQAPKTVTVEADKTATVKFKNTLKKWSVKIIKKDSETGKPIPYSGAGFQVYYPDGRLVSMNGSDVFTTDDNGSITTPEPLPYGKRYYLVEVNAPYGYVLDSTSVYFDVTDESTTEEKGIMLIKTEKSNPPQMGRITVEKFGEIFIDVITPDDPPVIPTPPEEFIESDMLMMAKAAFEPLENELVTNEPEPTENDTPKTYQPVYSVTGLSGAVFEVYAAEDITTPDGTVRVKKDTLVATLTTDESGRATSKQLYLGKYRIVEIKAPYGMLLNGEPKNVALTYAGQNQKITTVAAEFHNDRQQVKIDLQKITGIDERFALGINDEILNVSFGLFADEDIIAASGRMIQKDGLIEVIGCDENGYAEFTTDLPFGSYYVQELTTDEHYILSDTKYPILFEYAGQEIDTVHIKANNGEPIINELISGTVKGLKIDRETEETIEGAVFELFSDAETVYNEDTAILTATSDNNGVFTFENVPYGKYIVHEIQPAPGYMANDNNYPVTISENEEVVEITAINDRYPEIRTTAMIEGKKEVGATDVFTLEDTVEYKHLIPGKEYTIKGILMYKATNAPFLSDGKEVTSEVVFTPEQANGVVIVSFDFNAALITEETDIVVFERLYHNGIELTAHADIEDENQTVRIRLPKIRTKANIEGKKEITTDKPVIITDIVSFDDLTIGKEYKLVGVLMDKATGKPYAVDGKEITADVVFTAEKKSGEIKVEFTFDGKVITKDTELVVFETLYLGSNEIAVHEDINDKDQTVTIRPVPVIPPPTINIPKTGDDTNLSLWLSIGAVAVGAIISFLIVKFRRKDEDDDE